MSLVFLLSPDIFTPASRLVLRVHHPPVDSLQPVHEHRIFDLYICISNIVDMPNTLIVRSAAENILDHVTECTERTPDHAGGGTADGDGDDDSDTAASDKRRAASLDMGVKLALVNELATRRPEAEQKATLAQVVRHQRILLERVGCILLGKVGVRSLEKLRRREERRRADVKAAILRAEAEAREEKARLEREEQEAVARLLAARHENWRLMEEEDDLADELRREAQIRAAAIERERQKMEAEARAEAARVARVEAERLAKERAIREKAEHEALMVRQDAAARLLQRFWRGAMIRHRSMRSLQKRAARHQTLQIGAIVVIAFGMGARILNKRMIKGWNLRQYASAVKMQALYRGARERRRFRKTLAGMPPALDVIREHGAEHALERYHPAGGLGVASAGPWRGQITVPSLLSQGEADCSDAFVSDAFFDMACRSLE